MFLSMEFIGGWAYAFCCLLPFLAFLILTLQFFKLKRPVRLSAPNSAFMVDEIRFNIEGLIAITSEIQK